MDIKPVSEESINERKELENKFKKIIEKSKASDPYYCFDINLLEFKVITKMCGFIIDTIEEYTYYHFDEIFYRLRILLGVREDGSIRVELTNDFNFKKWL